jgi:hypothetical protein
MEKLVPYVKEKYADVTINFNKENPTSFVLKTKQGFNFSISHDNIVVEFSYVVNYIKKSGQFPFLKHDELRSYSDILKETQDNIAMTWDIFSKLSPHSCGRIGLMANCSVSEAELPPGISLFSDHIARPWDAGLRNMSGTITSKISENEVFIEQCHHTIERNFTGEKDEAEIKLDFQRIFKEEKNKDMTQKIILEFSEKAVEYFEKFGMGDLNYG